MRSLPAIPAALAAAFLAACVPDPGGPGGEAPWRLVALDGEAFGALATMDLSQPGRATGEGPCNRWFADRRGPPPGFPLGPIGATRRACDQLALEGRFFAALASVDRIAESGPGRLRLTGGGREMVFVRP